MRGVLNEKGQVWVETVIYALIGLAIIGLVLAAALPKINNKKDEIMIEQSIEALGNIDDKIYEVQRAPGNRRSVDLGIAKGAFIVNMDDNTVSWILDSRFPYSEVGIPVSLGKMNVITKEKGSFWEVGLTLKYDLDVRYNGIESGVRKLEVAAVPYKLVIENMGVDLASGNMVVDFSDK